MMGMMPVPMAAFSAKGAPQVLEEHWAAEELRTAREARLILAVSMGEWAARVRAGYLQRLGVRKRSVREAAQLERAVRRPAARKQPALAALHLRPAALLQLSVALHQQPVVLL